MGINLKGRSLLTLRDYSAEEIIYLLDLAARLKQRKAVGETGDSLKGKNIVLIFDKPSTRTRCAFEVACYDEGGHSTYLENSHLGHKESIEDTARVLGCYFDGIEFRGYKHTDAEALQVYSGVPVWNGLTDLYHPTQALADILTIKEYIQKPISDVKIVFVGNSMSNVGRSLMISAAKLNMNFMGLSSKTFWPDSKFLEEMQVIAKATELKLNFSEDVAEAVEAADVIYTDVWVSMGEENQLAKRIELMRPYQVTMDMLKASKNPYVKFMHCLPAFHNLETEVAKTVQQKFNLTEMEVTDEVFRSHASIILDQTENRMHTIKALLVATLVGNTE